MDLLCLESWKGWDFSCFSSCVYSVEAEEIKGFKATFSAVFRAHLTTETTGLQLNIENCVCLERCEKWLLRYVTLMSLKSCWQYPRFFSSPGPQDDEKLAKLVLGHVGTLWCQHGMLEIHGNPLCII